MQLRLNDAHHICDVRLDDRQIPHRQFLHDDNQQGGQQYKPEADPHYSRQAADKIQPDESPGLLQKLHIGAKIDSFKVVAQSLDSTRFCARSIHLQ